MRREEVDKVYRIEHSHWWYVGTREICFDLMNRIIFKKSEKARFKILDVGCGTGGNLEYFKTFGNARGIDCDDRSVDYCRGKGLEVSTGDMKNLLFEKNTFDLVSFFDVLYHIPYQDQPDILRGIKDLLAKDGHIVLREPALKAFSGRHDREVGILKRYNRHDMSDLLTKSGFEIVYCSYINILLAIPILLKRKFDLVRDASPRSDVVETGAMLNSLLLGILRLEKTLLRSITFPFGVSLFVIARKKPAG
ncbi:MAG: methyltransferase domain-containing protein [Chitinispirillaceae bacterium]|nr:methyltransferase domain-containing protein [Chitinispirillaceae bacterium]